MSKTLFIDIDGTILPHLNTTLSEYVSLYYRGELEDDPLPGVAEKFSKWSKEDCTIVLTTARPESMRAQTHAQLTSNGLFYDHLIMGLPTGSRHVINDTKSDGTITAIAHPVIRNEGLTNVNI